MRRLVHFAAAIVLLWGGAARADAVPAPSGDGSLKIVGQRRFETAPNNTLTQGQTKCSVSVFVRLDSPPRPNGSGAWVLFRSYYSGPMVTLGLDHTGKLFAGVAWTPPTGPIVQTKIEIAPGVSHHIATTWDGEAGEQWVYVDGVGYKFGTLKGATMATGARAIGVGGNDNATVPADFAFTVDDLSIWDGYRLTPQDVLDLRDSRKLPKDVGTSATRRVVWSFAGPEGGPSSGTVNQLGTGSDLTVSTGSGTATYAKALDWSPPVQVVDAYVTTSGELAAFRFATTAGNATTTPKTINTLPTFRRNGIPIPTSDKPAWITGFHNVILVPLSERIRPGDVVTADAPSGWVLAFHGQSTGLNAAKLENRVGKSSLNSEVGPKTLKPGVNFSFTGSGADTPYCVPKNQIKKLGFWNAGTQVTPDGRPTTLTGTSSYAELVIPAGETGIDNILNQCPVGLHAVGWDDTDPANPDTWTLEDQSGNAVSGNAVVTERVDLRNNGTLVGGKIVGKVRVFDIQKPPTATRAAHQIIVRCTNASGTSRSENQVVYGPKDFAYTDGVPVVLDKSNPYAVSNVFKERFASGAGSFRWMDCLVHYTGNSHDCEIEHITSSDDFRWGYNTVRYRNKSSYVEVRPYNPATSHIYSAAWGSRYDVTLAQPIDAVQTTIQILWSDANPVIPHLRLYLPNGDCTEEVMRVVSIPNNPVDGQVADVVVTRGKRLDLPAGKVSFSDPRPHAAGTIQCGFRVPGPAMSSFVFGKGVCYEIVSDKPHDLWSCTSSSISGSWPAVALTNGKTASPMASGNSIWVTGPKTLLLAGYSNDPVATLAAPVALNPANCWIQCEAPGSATIPYDYAAYATGQVDGCDLWLNIPAWATDDLVIEIARRCRDKFPPGRNVFVEWCNEPWNGGFPQAAYTVPISKFLYNSAGGVYSLVCHQTKRIGDLFEAVFNEGGRNRGSEIKRTINFQPRAPFEGTLNYAKSMSPPLKVDAAATSPYVNVPDGDYASQDLLTSLCQFRWSTEQAIDLWTHHLKYNVSPQSFPLSFVMQKSHIDAYNAATGNDCKLVGYEGGVEFPITAKEITPPGTVSVTNGSPTVAGSGTQFRKYFLPGQSIVVRATAGDCLYRVLSVESDTSLTMSENYDGVSESGRSHKLSTLTITPLAGTVSVTNLSRDVVGTGTSFDQSLKGKILGVRTPDGVFRYGHSHWSSGSYQYHWIKSVTDATHLKLDDTIYYGWIYPSATGCRIYDVEEHCDTKARDMVTHPNWYFVDQDFYKLMQDHEVYRWSVFCYAGAYFKGRYTWPIYAWAYQEPGYGDGRDGKADNRLTLAERGFPNSKPVSTSKEYATVSVRGQALLDWNSGAMRPLAPWASEDRWEVATFDPLAGYGPTLGYDTPEQAEAARNRLQSGGASNVHVRRVRVEVVPAGK